MVCSAVENPAMQSTNISEIINTPNPRLYTNLLIYYNGARGARITPNSESPTINNWGIITNWVLTYTSNNIIYSEGHIAAIIMAYVKQTISNFCGIVAFDRSSILTGYKPLSRRHFCNINSTYLINNHHGCGPHIWHSVQNIQYNLHNSVELCSHLDCLCNPNDRYIPVPPQRLQAPLLKPARLNVAILSCYNTIKIG
jgi:hypothetical protein